MRPASACLLAAVIALVPLAGCADDATDGQAPVAIVTADGTVEEHGPERQPYACGRPLWSAGLALEDETLTLVEAEDRRLPIRLALWETVEAVHAGNWTACEWPRLTTTDADDLTWTLEHRNLERPVDLALEGEALVVDGERLAPGTNTTLAIAHAPETGNGSSYRYTGNVTVTYHGLWPAKSIEAVDGEGNVTGHRGTWNTHR